MWSRSHSQDLQLAFPAVQPHRVAAQPSLTGGEGSADGVLSNFLAAGLEVGKGPREGLALASDLGVQVNLSSVSLERIC